MPQDQDKSPAPRLTQTLGPRAAMKAPPATRERSLSRAENIFAEKARVTPSEMDVVAETHTHG